MTKEEERREEDGRRTERRNKNEKSKDTGSVKHEHPKTLNMKR
jgi:hypothetical protein